MIGVEPSLVIGYALFLLACALVLDLLARHSHNRAARYRTAGFSYHGHLDAWVCPEGEHLWLHETDEVARLARYRGRPQVCNACPAKPRCTDSDDGREVVRALDPWPHSEAGRFHRGIAVFLVALGMLMALAELVRHHRPLEAAALLVLLALLAAAALRLGAVFVATPANAPEAAVQRAGKAGA